MEKTVRIFMTCAFGVFIGSLIALQMYQMFWWVGMIVGGFVSYISYNFKAVLAAISRAYNTAQGWRPDIPVWKEYFRIGFVGMGIVQTVYVALYLFFFIIRFMDSTPAFAEITTLDVWRSIGLEFVMMSAIGFFYGFIFLVLLVHADDLKNCKLTYQTTNPFYLFHLFFYRLLRMVYWIVQRIPNALIRSGAFIKHFSVIWFKEIHSDIRLLCACDAALGTAVGYFSSNALIGALAGGVLGVINYEIITVRVMKLAGVKSMFK